MKSRIVGSRIGVAGLAIRGFIALRSISFRNPEQAAAVANAILAERLVVRLPADGESFLDIGAHIGSVFSAVHQHNPSVILHAIEADRAKATALQARFPYCRIYNCAVGETPGMATFHLHGQSGYNSLVAPAADRKTGDQKSVEVEVRMLDHLLQDAPLDYIKMDIEGAELGALRGGQTVLNRTRPTIMFESASAAENTLGYSAEQLWHWFDTAGFMVVTPDRLAHDAPPLSLETFLDAHAYPMRTHNYFAVPVEKRTVVRDRAREILGIR